MSSQDIQINAVRDWFAKRSSPTGTRAERVAELAEIVDRLGRVMEPDYIPVWLSKPIEARDLIPAVASLVEKTAPTA